MDALGVSRKWTVLLGVGLGLIVVALACDDEPRAYDPVVELLSCPPDTVSCADTCFFEWTGSDRDGRVIGYHYCMNDESPRSWTTAVACTLTDPPLGRNVFSVQAEDDDQRRSQTASCAFTVVEGGTACEVSVDSLDFGSVGIGDVSERHFTITNIGEGVLSGEMTESSDDYYIVSDKDYSLEEGESQEVTLVFAPTSCGTIDGVIYPGNEACSAISCTGEGLDGGYEITPTELDFGMTNPGAGTARQLKITNYGCTTLFGTISEQCDHYEITCGGGDFALPTLQMHSALVVFNPPSCGTYTCNIKTGNPLLGDISCTGTCVDGGCQISPTHLDFGTLPLGQSSDLSFTIRNNKCGKLVGSIRETCSHYSIVHGGGMYSLLPGTSRLVTVRFRPSASGTHTCTIDMGNQYCGDVRCTGVGESGEDH